MPTASTGWISRSTAARSLGGHRPGSAQREIEGRPPVSCAVDGYSDGELVASQRVTV